MKIQQMYYHRQDPSTICPLLRTVYASEEEKETVLAVFRKMDSGNVYRQVFRGCVENFYLEHIGTPFGNIFDNAPIVSEVSGRKLILFSYPKKLLGVISEGRHGILITVDEQEPEYRELQEIYNRVKSMCTEHEKQQKRDLTTKILYGEETTYADL